jgi:sulfoxide reductase heme-binding subunit YedZ
MVLLVLSLACTPVNTLFGWRQALKLRRPLGLYAFLYAFAHFLIFAGLDYRFDLTFLPDAILEKPFILLGLASLIILTLLAITSFRWWMKRLGKNWKRLHKLIYLAVLLVLIHFAWSQKGDLSRLQGDILQPVLFSMGVGILLLMRVPPIRRRLVHFRQIITSTWMKHMEKKHSLPVRKSGAEL